MTTIPRAFAAAALATLCLAADADAQAPASRPFLNQLTVELVRPPAHGDFRATSDCGRYEPPLSAPMMRASHPPSSTVTSLAPNDANVRA